MRPAPSAAAESSASESAAAGPISAASTLPVPGALPAVCGADDRLREAIEADPYRHGTVATALGAVATPPIKATADNAENADRKRQSSAHPEQQRQKIELEGLVKKYRGHENSHVQLGWFAYCWVSAQADRAAAIDAAEAAITAAGLDGRRVRIDRDIAVFWCACIFGWRQSQTLNVSILRALAPLIVRNPAAQVETWVLREASAEPARALWRAIAAAEKKPAGEWVRERVAEILPPRKRRRKALISRRVLAARQALAKLVYQEVIEFLAEVERRAKELAARAQAPETAMPAAG